MSHPNPRDRRRKKAAILVACLVVIGGLWLGLRRGGPHDGERSYVGLLADQNWSALYDMAPHEEFQRSAISRLQFNRLMRDLATDLPKTYFLAAIEAVPEAEREVERGEHYVLLTFPDAPKREGKAPQLLLRAMRGREGWTIPSQELPLTVARWHQGSPNAHWERLLRAMRAAEVKEYPVNMSGLRLHADRLAEYLQGHADYASVYSE